MDVEKLRIQYSNIVRHAERLRETMVEQIFELLNGSQITLGVPMESRVKQWSSIEEKIERKNLSIVRTLAQHIWAAASHKLQYKHESSVPQPLVRTINRVSALLETVDLEFDRVLSERKLYQDTGIPQTKGSDKLNVDLLKVILNEKFSPGNVSGQEDYDELLKNLSDLSINTIDKFCEILDKHRDEVLKEDKKRARDALETRDYALTSQERSHKGVFYTLTGLARVALHKEFGKKFFDLL